MGGISSGIGLVSGINSANIIEQLLGLEAKGKTPFLQRVANLSAQRTALLDVNARLLNLKSAGSKFRIDKIFQSSLATPSDDTLLSAVADKATLAGSYQFLIKRLASVSQFRTKGFATSDASPLGLDEMRFEFGDIGVRRTIDLAALNGGEGIRRGKIAITDRSGATATVDLSSATTLEEVIQLINGEDGFAVSASLVGERLRLVDSSGGTGSFKVVDVGGGAMAADLGIAGSVAGGTIISSQVNRLGMTTALSSLNDGLGVLIRDGVTDFKLQVGTKTYDVRLGRENAPITANTQLNKLNNGLGIKINSTDAADFVVQATDGQQVSVNLGAVIDGSGVVTDQAVTTVGQLLTRVNTALADKFGTNKVVMGLRGDGKGFTLTDSLGGSANPLRVLGAGPSGDGTAKDLGIWTGAAGGSGAVITGTVVPNTVATPRASTIQDVADRILAQTEGSVKLEINAAGTGLALSANGDTVTVLPGALDGSSQATAISERTVRDLGLFGGTGSLVSGQRVLAGAGTVLTSTLNGGAGLGGDGSITLTNRAGSSVTINGLDALTTLEEITDAINAAGASIQMSVAIGNDNASLAIKDTSGGTGALSVSGAAATKLRIAGSSATDTLRGANLQLRWVSEAQSVKSLNYGRGIGVGSFRLTDSTGAKATVDIGADSATLYDIIQEINSRGLAIEARLNDNGDGISLVDTNAGSPTVKMKVEDLTGKVAAALSIKGEAKAAGDDLLGSYERVIDLDPTDSLSAVVAKIKASGAPLTAAIVNSGGANPFALALTSGIGGRAGRMTISTGGVDVGLTAVAQGIDAEILFGNSDPALGIALRSGSNLFEDVVTGLDITAKKVSTSVVTVDVARDQAKIKESVKAFTAAFNDVIGRIDDYDSYDVDSKKRGPLLGNSTVATARQQLFTMIQGKAKGVTGPYQFLSQVGIKLGKDGELQFDESKFDSVYAEAPEAVEALFATFEQQQVSGSSPFPGVTIGSSKVVATALGFGDLIDQAVKGMTNTVDGTFSRASSNMQTLIDRTNERIKAFDARLETRRTRLERQFAAMEEAISKLQTQQSALGSILG